MLVNRLPGLAGVPLRDANPTTLCLVWDKSTGNPLVEALVATARSLGNGATSEPAVKLPASVRG